MNNLIIGSNSRFGKILIESLPGTYLGRQDFDLLNPNFDQFKNTIVDNVIFLSKGNSKNFSDAGKVCDSMFYLLDTIKYNTAWIFTSGLGTYGGSKNYDSLFYSAEKALINFVAYKKIMARVILKLFIQGTWILRIHIKIWSMHFSNC
jgi:hypothetical protein